MASVYLISIIRFSFSCFAHYSIDGKYIQIVILQSYNWIAQFETAIAEINFFEKVKIIWGVIKE